LSDRELFLNDRVALHAGDCREVLREFPDNHFDSVVTDPPYALVSIVKRFGGANAAPATPKEGAMGAYARASAGFMGKQWDTGETAFAVEFWAEVCRVLKPGGHVVAFSGTRTYHRTACAIEDANFEIRDQLAWVYGSGFPKSHDVSKGIDKAAGAEREVIGRRTDRAATPKQDIRGGNLMNGVNGGIDCSAITAPATDAARQWEGYGTALKPAWEPIVLARKPLIGTVAENVLEHGTGAINIDGCRVGESGGTSSVGDPNYKNEVYGRGMGGLAAVDAGKGRWPANIIHDGSEEVLACFPTTESGARQAGVRKGLGFHGANGDGGPAIEASAGSAARFFYSAKADKNDRIGSKHPTVKPVDLMQWLVRLVTPKGGLVLDPFAGTGTTGEAAFREGMRAVLIEREAEYRVDIARRLDLANAGPVQRKHAITTPDPVETLPLFGGLSGAVH
jgi:DNA modification methylase